MKFNEGLDSIVDALYSNKDNHGVVSRGELNYVISSIIWEIFDKNRSYDTANDLIGALECVKDEFYRRRVAKLEDEKIKENGDL